jgi:RNA polymerase sigma factor (sigma-70 family)
MTRVPASRPASRPVTGVRDDLERVFRSEYGRVVAAARRVLGTGREAEDVAQDVFIAFSRTTVPAGEARGWLITAAAHTALNSLRSDTRRARRESAVAVPDQVPDVADEVVAGANRARVREVLGRLPRTQALVLVLRHSGLSYQEVAAALGMPVGSVGTTLRRAEAAVRKELESDESPG